MNVMGGHWGVIVIAAAAATIVAGIGGAVTTIGPWYRGLNKPSWQPPNWLFAPVWTLIFALVATAGVIGWETASSRVASSLMLGLLALNGGFNIAWSYLFFTKRRPDWALIDIAPLWLTIAALIATISQFSPFGAWMLVPYLLWVSFAGYLNYVIVRLNPPFGPAGKGH